MRVIHFREPFHELFEVVRIYGALNTIRKDWMVRI